MMRLQLEWLGKEVVISRPGWKESQAKAAATPRPTPRPRGRRVLRFPIRPW